MNLSDLKKAVLARKGKTVEVPEWGLSVSFLPISAERTIAIHGAIQALPRAGSGEILGSPESLSVYVDAIALTIANDSGERYLDSDEGRAFLRSEPFFAVERLAKHALHAAGILAEESRGEPKNSPTPAETST